MKNKLFLGFALAGLFTAIACGENASSKIDPNAQPVSSEVAEAPVTPAQPTTPVTTAETAVDPNAKYPVIEFDKMEHDFGSIDQSGKATHTFKFKNTGEADLIIQEAKGSCGCTVPDYPKQAIKPGESGEIEVSFDPQGRPGTQMKNVTVKTNTARGMDILKIKANVKQN